MIDLDENYWSQRYEAKQTGWDIGYASPALMQYLDQIENKDISILIPGAGNGYEAVAAYEMGFSAVHILDFSPIPLAQFEANAPNFPKAHIHQENFFTHQGEYDLILEQTFFCSLPIAMREDYAKKMKSLLKPGGKLAGLLFNREFPMDGPPFGGNVESYTQLFSKYFESVVLEPTNASIPQRRGTEVFLVAKN